MVRYHPLKMSVSAISPPAAVTVPSATATHIGYPPDAAPGGTANARDTLGVYLGGTYWTGNPLVPGNTVTDDHNTRYADWVDYLGGKETPFANGLFIGSVGWDRYAEKAAEARNPVPNKIPDYSVPTTSTDDPSWIGFPFAETNSGVRDSIWVSLADSLIANGNGNASIRISHEADLNFTNGTHQLNRPDDYWWGAGDPFSATEKYTAFKNAWNRIAGIMASRPGADFDFFYCANGPAGGGQTDVNGDWLFEAAFPGTQYCSTVGYDLYFSNASLPEREERLNRILNFGKQYGLKFALGEWAVRASPAGADWPESIEFTYDYLSRLPATGPGALNYHVYFNGNQYSHLNTMPNSKAKFKELFGDP